MTGPDALRYVFQDLGGKGTGKMIDDFKKWNNPFDSDMEQGNLQRKGNWEKCYAKNAKKEEWIWTHRQYGCVWRYRDNRKIWIVKRGRIGLVWIRGSEGKGQSSSMWVPGVSTACECTCHPI